ncbi:HD-GYP domain-containing protein [Streptomyces liangshanensis]|uniref:HD-GYP domain-containing protein n=1 Tax=Streptomyces liangshanensis TaxID=2717324 RepID=A0A6G9GXN9_9ACTN|nr:HD-GYP domain-containing protein [Streptomyces liangshanensis]QIQ02761.1 HD-GYP domain-containing protein [Streptomyces liangshanensis]
MRAIPGAARAYILGAALCAAFCLLPAFRAGTPWRAVALLAALYALCEMPARCRVLGRSLHGSVPIAAGSFFPVLLASALLLPPAAAALVAVPGALLGRVEQRPRGARRIWRAAQLSLATWAAARAQILFGGPVALGGGGYGLKTPDFPYVLLPAGAATLAFCLVLATLDGGVLAAAERLPLRTAWRGLFVRSLAPHGAHGLAGLMMAVLWRSPYGPLSALFVLLPMYISCWVFAQYHRESAAHQATIRALVQAVDIKDKYTRGHSERVGRASVLIAQELGMDRDRVEVLRFAGILHDVGKLGVPTRVLRKDGPLTPDERRVIELHPEYGHEMVRGIGFLGEAREAILHHHERLDGSGYPYGLAGAQIPEFARVVAVADAFDAMTSTRSYSRARPVGTAVAELERCAGSQFDPDMVDALVRALARHGWQTAVTADEKNGPPSGGRTGAAAPVGEGLPVPAPVRQAPAPGPAPAPEPGAARRGLPAVPRPPAPRRAPRRGRA